MIANDWRCSPQQRLPRFTCAFALIAAVLLAGSPAFGSMIITVTPGTGLAANPAALAAFDRAALAWESLFTDNITVNIAVDLVDLHSSTILGQTSTVVFGAGYNAVRNVLVADSAGDPSKAIVASLPTAAQFSAVGPTGFTLSGDLEMSKANGKALGISGLDAAFGANDATMTFNSGFHFGYDSQSLPPGYYDFQSVATHEIGHVLGFLSAVDTVDAMLAAQQTGPITPFLLDLYRFDSQDLPANAAQFTLAPRNLTTSGSAYFSDTTDTYAFSTGKTQGDRRQASHWKDDALTGNYIGIMDPTLSSGVSRSITSADIRALELIGFDEAPEPGTIGLAGVALAALLAGGRRQRRT